MTRFFATAVDDARFYEVECSVCHSKSKVKKIWHGTHYTTMQVTLMLRQWGWHIAGKPFGDVCRNCLRFEAHRPSNDQHKTETIKMTVSKVAPKITPAINVTPAAPVAPVVPFNKPPEITREARRKIFSSIDFNYDPTKGSYTNGKTDAIIAKELNLPIAWVKLIRDEAFGPEGADDQTVKLIAEAKELLSKSDTDAKVLLLAHTELVERMKKLEDQIEKLSKLYR